MDLKKSFSFFQYPTPVVSESAQCRMDYKRAGSLPDGHNLDVKSKDLLLRLLEIDPTKRLRSIRVLQTLGFYMGFDFEELKLKKVIFISNIRICSRSTSDFYCS